jgi:hypothetical protein
MPEPWHEVDAAMKRDDVENDQDRALRPFFDVNRVNGDIAVGKTLGASTGNAGMPSSQSRGGFRRSTTWAIDRN